MRIQLFTIILIVKIILISNSNGFACLCSNYTPFLSSVKYSNTVIEGIVLGHKTIKPTSLSNGFYGVLFHIEKVYNGNINRDTVLIAESRGFECYNSKFEDGKSYFVQGKFTSVLEIGSNGFVEVVNEILVPSACTESTILIEDEKVCGTISIIPYYLNHWFYNLIGKIRKFSDVSRSKYIECMALKKLRRKLENINFEG